MVKGKFVVFGTIMETDRWLLLSKSMWTEDRHYLYDKKNRKLGYMDGKDNRGFTNDLDGFNRKESVGHRTESGRQPGHRHR